MLQPWREKNESSVCVSYSLLLPDSRTGPVITSCDSGRFGLAAEEAIVVLIRQFGWQNTGLTRAQALNQWL